MGPLIVGFCLLSGLDAASGQQRYVRAYDTGSGLPQRQVLAIHQDRTGYLWFGTHAGVTRFDGGTFRTFDVDHGLTSPIVRSLASAAGDLIAGTEAGVCMLAGSDFQCLGPDDGLPGPVVHDILPEPDGTLWLATSGGVVRLRDRGAGWHADEHGLPGEAVLALARGPDGGLWVGTERGLARREGSAFVPVGRGTLAGQRVNVLSGFSAGLLIGTNTGLYRLDDAGLHVVPLPPGSGHPAFIDAGTDGASGVWLVSRGAGAFRYDAGRLQPFGDDRLAERELYAALVDREGSLWIGTNEGVVQFVPGPFTTFRVPDGLPNPVVRAITEDDRGRLWLGTKAGVAVYDGQGFRTAIPAAALRDPRVWALAFAPDGGLFVGTDEGLVLWDGSVQARYDTDHGLPDRRVRSILRDGRRTWIGTRNGVARLEDDTIVPFPGRALHTALDPLDMVRDHRGAIWMGLMSGGVAVVDDEEVSLLGAADGLTDELVWDLEVDDAGRIWIATNGDGAYRHDPVTGETMRLSTGEGLANDYVWSVLCDSRGAVWLYTNQGLDRYHDGAFRHFDRGDGLHDLEGNATAAWEARDGTLWFGSATALVRYDPESDRPNLLPPTVVIGEVRGPDGVLEAGSTLPARFDEITIPFAGLSFRDVTGVRFRYRLLGLSERWSAPTPARIVRYARLPPGRYEFQVHARNDDGVWSTTPASFSFAVAPAFWQTWWFRLAVVLAVGAIIWLATVLRTRHLEADRRHLAEVVRRNTEELRRKNLSLEREMRHREEVEEQLVQARKLEAVGRLAGGIAHDFNNITTTIVGFADVIDEELGEDSGVHDELSEIKRAALQAARLTKQLLAFSRRGVTRPETLELNETVRESAGMLRRLIGEDVHLELELDAERGTITVDRGQVEQVLVNLVLNARDAMPDGGTLTIRTADEELTEPVVGHDGEPAVGPHVSLSVTDTGCGMSDEVQSRIFEPFFTTKDVGEGTGLGLATVYGIVKQSGGHVLVESREGHGSTFTILFPRHDGARTRPPAQNVLPLTGGEA